MDRLPRIAPPDETAEIDAALARAGAPIPPSLQQAFNEFQLQNYRSALLLVNLLAHLAYFLFGFADAIVVPDVGTASFIARSAYLSLTLPVMLLVVRRAKQMLTVDLLLPLEILFATIIWFVLLNHSNHPEASTYKYASMVFIVLANLSVQHCFLPALLISLLIAGATLAGSWLIERDSEGQFLIFCLAYFPIFFFSLFSSWSTTRGRRRAFLREAREQKLRQLYARFTAMVSHEFRNPLGVIDSQLALLRREAPQRSEDAAKRLDIIAKSSRRLAVLFDRWLQHDQTDHRLKQIRLEDIRLDEWLDTVVKDAEPILQRHTVTVLVDPDAACVASDKALLETALSNLLENAAKYSPAGSRIRISSHRQQHAIGIAVTDQGKGMPPGRTGEIFDAYQRLQTDSGPGGLGLGLALTRKIISALGGEVEVRSEPAKGSTFTLWLPACGR